MSGRSNNIKGYFTFSRRELRGILVLVLILMALTLYNLYIPAMVECLPPDHSGFQDQIHSFMQQQTRINDSMDSARNARKNRFHSRKIKTAWQATKPTAGHIVELNAADSAKLTEIRGIGPVFASRILKYRALLGGFYCREQLQEVYGIDSSRYAHIATQVNVDTTLLRKIRLDSVTFKNLLRHPYLEYEDVKAIFNRDTKALKTLTRQDFMKIKGIKKQTAKKILPYLAL
ncbi:MAG: helix-hairpin-helix domain-containing protein [Bacteroidales bacterium]